MGYEEEDEEDGWQDQRPASDKKKPLDRAQILKPEEGNGTVVEIFPNQASVRLDGAATGKLCGYRMSTLAARGALRERSPVCVGDRVKVEVGVVVGRCERRNSLSRSAPNARNPLIHVVAANLDLLVVVASAKTPDFTPGIIDRFLDAAKTQNIPTLVCVTKVDLLVAGDPRPWRAYEALEISREAHVRHVLAAVSGKTTAFCGHSGVGKTSLLRRLLGDDAYGRVGAVNAGTGMGRHTTTGAVMLRAPDGSDWIDTPGIMNFEAA